MKRVLLFLTSIILLSSCTPSPEAIQKAIAQTQTAMPTPLPTRTPIPTATINPCTDNGWSDISIYFKQFEDQKPVVGTSVLAYVESLKNYQNKINGVTIDACSEHARQTIVEAMGNYIYVMGIIIGGGKLTSEEKTTTLLKYALMLKDSKQELAGLGIIFDY
jgi:hypothetical protein